MNQDIEIQKATLDDIVFEQRNKSYGAYLLRKLYDKNVLLALFISISFFSLLLAIPVITKYLSPEEVVEVEEPVEEIKIIDIPLDPTEAKAIPIEPPKPPEIKQVKFVAFEPAPDKEVKEKVNFKVEDVNVSTINKEGKDTIMDLPPAVEIGTGVLPAEDDGIWMGAVTKNVEFPGGNAAFAQYIKSHMDPKAIRYASERDVHGKISVFFVVNKDGSVEDVQILPGKELANCKLCNEAAIDVIKNSPKWVPAENNGNPVKVRFRVPIVF